MAVFAALYFSQRQSYMLGQYGIPVSAMISTDLLLLQIQFLIAMLALNLLSVILLISIYRYMSYKEYQGDMDALTNIMGRRMFFSHFENCCWCVGFKGKWSLFSRFTGGSFNCT